MALKSDDRVAQTAQVFFDNVASDLLALGGVLVNPADLVKEFSDPQICELVAECGGEKRPV